jgi:hypothetical protein
MIARDMLAETERWTITDYLSINGVWEMWGEEEWPFPFCPILHWQNLPTIDGPCGEPDITQDVVDLQDRYNMLASNMSKVLRLTAHPQKVLKNGDLGTSVDLGPDKIVKISGDNTDLYPLFDITRTVDIDSVSDKLGALTNFGLRVLYQDNSAKMHTKQELFGDMLEELVRRLQILAGMTTIKAEAKFKDFIPENPAELAQLYQGELAMGVVDKQTVSKKLGYDWDQVQERMSQEQAAGDNVGAALLRAFDRGQ